LPHNDPTLGHPGKRHTHTQRRYNPASTAQDLQTLMEEHPDRTDRAPAPETPRRNSWGQALRSALSAGFGVQSNANRERDFAQGSVAQFIVIGVALIIAFIAALALFVSALTA